jgi:hypothetical protein
MNGGSLKSLVQRQMLQNPTPLYSDAAALDMCLQVRWAPPSCKLCAQAAARAP